MVNVYEIRPGSYATKAEVADAEADDVSKEYVDEGLATKQDVLTAGSNITIVENVISATGGGAEYTAGSGIAISEQNVISNSAPNVQADWNAVSGDAVILNKPTIPDAQVQSNWNESDTNSKAYIQNKPTIPAAQVNADWNASSGVAKILNKPTIPSGDDLVPSTTGATQGDVLTVGASGPEWATPGGSAPSNMVTTDTAQTITGLKTVESASDLSSNWALKVGGTNMNAQALLVSRNTNPGSIILGSKDLDGNVVGTPYGTYGRIFCAGDGYRGISVGGSISGEGMHELAYSKTRGWSIAGNRSTPDNSSIATFGDIADKANMTKDAGAPTTATVGTEGDFYYDTTNDKLYQCTAVTGDGGDPEVFTYTWTEVGGGSAPSNMVTTDTVQTITASKIMSDTPLNFTTIDTLKGIRFSASDGPLALTTLGPNSSFVLADLYVVGWNNAAYKCNTINSAGGFSIITVGPSSGNTDITANNNIGVSWPMTPNPNTSTGAKLSLSPTSDKSKRLCVNAAWVLEHMPEFTITGDGTTTVFTVAHSLGKMPGIVQITNESGRVIGDSECTITKDSTNVVIGFNTAPAADAVYTVAMLY